MNEKISPAPCVDYVTSVRLGTSATMHTKGIILTRLFVEPSPGTPTAEQLKVPTPEDIFFLHRLSTRADIEEIYPRVRNAITRPTDDAQRCLRGRPPSSTNGYRSIVVHAPIGNTNTFIRPSETVSRAAAAVFGAPGVRKLDIFSPRPADTQHVGGWMVSAQISKRPQDVLVGYERHSGAAAIALTEQIGLPHDLLWRAIATLATEQAMYDHQTSKA